MFIVVLLPAFNHLTFVRQDTSILIPAYFDSRHKDFAGGIQFLVELMLFLRTIYPGTDGLAAFASVCIVSLFAGYLALHFDDPKSVVPHGRYCLHQISDGGASSI